MTYINTNKGQLGTVGKGGFKAVGKGLTFTDIAQSKRGDLFGVSFNRLYKLNSRSGQSTLVGNLGVSSMDALGFTAKGQLYGATDSGFYKINSRTGAATLIAQIPNFHSSGDIAFNPVQNRFFATSNASSFQSDDLFSISLSGKATYVGSIGFDNVFGLSYDGRRLFGFTATGDKIAINAKTGQGTFKQTLLTNSQIWGAT